MPSSQVVDSASVGTFYDWVVSYHLTSRSPSPSVKSLYPCLPSDKAGMFLRTARKLSETQKKKLMMCHYGVKPWQEANDLDGNLMSPALLTIGKGQFPHICQNHVYGNFFCFHFRNPAYSRPLYYSESVSLDFDVLILICCNKKTDINNRAM